MKRKVENGFLHAQLDSFDELQNFANYFSDDLGFVFRGQAQSDWRLETTLDRLLRRVNPPNVDPESSYDFQLNNFVRAIRGRTAAIKDVNSNRDELWALGQHYGLATPLLDWTASLYVALFFAFIEPRASASGCRTVWAFHRNSIVSEMSAYNAGLAYNKQFAFIDPITDHNTRLVSQAGAFTRQPLNFDIPGWVQGRLKDVQEAHLFKIDVPENARLRILRNLRQMNIHSGTLFPDLAGASLDCNETIELFADRRKRDAEKAAKKHSATSV